MNNDFHVDVIEMSSKFGQSDLVHPQLNESSDNDCPYNECEIK